MWLTWLYHWFLSWWKKPPRPTLYEDTFLLTECNTCETCETDENRKKEQVEEKTPSGFVRMKYDEENKCFLYWSDTTIPTRYLDTVARKYVLVFNKREWYEKTEVEYTERKQADLAGPFVKSKHVGRKIEITKKMNKFKKQGGLKEVEVPKVEGKPMSYADFKQLVS
jgi:hypothetical protein